MHVTWLPMLGDDTVLSRDEFYKRMGRSEIPRAVRRRHVIGVALAIAGVAVSLFGLYEASGGGGERPLVGVPLMATGWFGGVGVGWSMYIDDDDGVSADQARGMIELAHF